MSKIFREYKAFDLETVSKETLKFWEENNVFEKSITTRDGKTPYIFFEGPPSANGLPGIHHVMARTIKDLFCRYKTLQGFKVERKAGWDTHGLPIELGVEKELGITKEDIGKKISVSEYNEACKKAVMRYSDIWEDLTKKMGYWVDMDDPYITYEPKYMETLWWLLKEMYKKGLLYKGYTIQPYSPKAGTGLSSHELNQPGTYQDITDTTVVAQFKAKHDSLPKFLKELKEDIYFLAWTTTPWTLPSNTALTVGKKIEYAVVKTFNQYTFQPVIVILAKNLVTSQFDKKYEKVDSVKDLATFNPEDKKIPYCIISNCSGNDLLGITYDQLLPYALPYQNPENAFRVIAGDFVTTEDGTGIVHTAPTFGADDALVAKQAIPEVPPMLVLDDNDQPVPLVDLQGRFTKHVQEHAGKYVKNEYYDEGEAPEKSVDVEIAIRLKEENKAFKVEKYKHSYPNCWRTDKPILYYPLNSWFVKITEVRDRMYELNNEINWKPASTGEGRFGNWLRNANDWNLSRSRFWGTPLPIWRTEDGLEELLIGSVEELKTEMKKSVMAGFMEADVFQDFVVGDMSDENYAKIDLHKNIVDQIILVSPSGKPMTRETDLIDVWFDSGAMPYAQWHYPFEHKEKIDEGSFFPADFIAEGVDQTRGWFYTLHAISTAVFDSIAYKNVVSNGLVLDKNGKKMSKRLGNAVDPFETMTNFGADATRWYLISNANPWDNLKFDIEGVDEVRRKF
ncbi:MAG: isoleucine--tRNA ligase, partial [Lutimonas sp.]